MKKYGYNFEVDEYDPYSSEKILKSKSMNRKVKVIFFCRCGKKFTSILGNFEIRFCIVES